MQKRYTLRDKIGGLGNDTVFRAYDTKLDREVSIKQFYLPPGNDPASAVNILQEQATKLAAVCHPNIVEVYDFVTDNGDAYMVLERIEGTNLNRYISTEGILTAKEFSEVAKQILEVLLAQESGGIPVQDLRPDRILVERLPSKKLVVKVADFELSFENGQLPQEEYEKISCWAPERFDGGSPDKRSEIYSVGCVLYYALTGKLPFDGTTLDEVRASHLSHSAPQLELSRRDMAPQLCNWVMWLINRKPEERPQSASKALLYLQMILEALEEKKYPSRLTTSIKPLMEAPPLKELASAARRNNKNSEVIKTRKVVKTPSRFRKILTSEVA